MLMLVSSADASDDAERGLVVQVVVTVALPLPVMLERCGGGEIEGCTRFTIIHLDWTCSQDALGWSVSGHGFTRALVYLIRPAVLGHEHVHINDIRDGANDYLQELAALRFDSQARCRSAGLTAAVGFEAHVRRLAAASMKKRHQQASLIENLEIP